MYGETSIEHCLLLCTVYGKEICKLYVKNKSRVNRAASRRSQAAVRVPVLVVELRKIPRRLPVDQHKKYSNITRMYVPFVLNVEC